MKFKTWVKDEKQINPKKFTNVNMTLLEEAYKVGFKAHKVSTYFPEIDNYLKHENAQGKYTDSEYYHLYSLLIDICWKTHIQLKEQEDYERNKRLNKHLKKVT